MKCLKKKQKLFDDSWLRDKPHHPQLRVPCKTISRRGKTTGIRHQSKAGDTKPHLFLLCFYGSAPSGCLWWFSWWCASPRLAVCPRRTEPPAVGCTHGWRSPPAGKTNKQMQMGGNSKMNVRPYSTAGVGANTIHFQGGFIIKSTLRSCSNTEPPHLWNGKVSGVLNVPWLFVQLRKSRVQAFVFTARLVVLVQSWFLWRRTALRLAVHGRGKHLHGTKVTKKKKEKKIEAGLSRNHLEATAAQLRLKYTWEQLKQRQMHKGEMSALASNRNDNYFLRPF